MVKNVPQDKFLERIFYGGKYELLKNSIWLEDDNGNRISNENKSSYDSLLRYYKAIFTGYKMDWTIKTKIPHKLSNKFLSSVIEIEVRFIDSDI